MQSWTRPEIPQLPGRSHPPRLFDTRTRSLLEARPEATAKLYVCGITPYDATHVGHAATYVAFDTLLRVWLDGGFRVHYAQNITDVDDPLLERATATGEDWRHLADREVATFAADMAALNVIPPDDYVAVTEVIVEIADAVCTLLDRGVAYRVPADDADGDDVYFDVVAAGERSPWRLGDISGLDEAEMLRRFREGGGDPDRPGKRSPLDPLLWRAARDGEPSWPSRVGAGRPGWHIECSVIALRHLGTDFTVQGGGADLVFPHHAFSAAHAAALSGEPLARLFSHAGLVAYQGEKMSKSLGNLVFVSRLRSAGVDPRAIRMAVLSHHYRSDWEWTEALLTESAERVERWADSIGSGGTGEAESPPTIAADVLDEMRAALRDDLDTPAAIAVVERAIAEPLDDPRLLSDAIDALLGIRLDGS